MFVGKNRVHKYFPMNVLILTPDRVGSTLLQRLITVYANLNENQQPLTINLHELTNGLVSYHNDITQQKLLLSDLKE